MNSSVDDALVVATFFAVAMAGLAVAVAKLKAMAAYRVAILPPKANIVQRGLLWCDTRLPPDGPRPNDGNQYPTAEQASHKAAQFKFHPVMLHDFGTSRSGLWYDPETDPSQFMAALWKVRHLCTRAEHVRMTVPGSHVLVQAIMSAIDDYAERETGNREYFWNKPHSAG